MSKQTLTNKFLVITFVMLAITLTVSTIDQGVAYILEWFLFGMIFLSCLSWLMEKW